MGLYGCYLLAAGCCWMVNHTITTTPPQNGSALRRTISAHPSVNTHVCRLCQTHIEYECTCCVQRCLPPPSPSVIKHNTSHTLCICRVLPINYAHLFLGTLECSIGSLSNCREKTTHIFFSSTTKMNERKEFFLFFCSF